MRKRFLRALLLTAVLQFVVTRTRAGRVENEGEAEILWARYPFVVVANALVWTLMLSAASGAWRALRRSGA